MTDIYLHFRCAHYRLSRAADISLNAEHGFCLLSILITGFIYGALAGVISTLLMVRGHIIGHARSNM